MVKKGTCGLCQGGCAVVYTIEKKENSASAVGKKLLTKLRNY